MQIYAFPYISIVHIINQKIKKNITFSFEIYLSKYIHVNLSVRYIFHAQKNPTILPETKCERLCSIRENKHVVKYMSGVMFIAYTENTLCEHQCI